MKKSNIHPMPQFFEVYIHQADDEEIIQALEKNLHILENLDIKKLESIGNKTYAPGKWTIKDILQHMIDTERVQSYRAMRLSRNDKTVLPGFDENLFASNTNLTWKTIRDLLDEYILLRKANIAMFKGFDDEMLMRSGLCFKVEISVLALGFVLCGHQIHHLRVIREKYLTL